MGDEGWVVNLSLDDGRATAAWMVGSFLVVFVVTRVITRMIRAGRGPSATPPSAGCTCTTSSTASSSCSLAGAGEFTYRPDGVWQVLLAVAFGAGAALTLDEFALWLTPVRRVLGAGGPGLGRRGPRGRRGRVAAGPGREPVRHRPGRTARRCGR